MGTGEVGGWLEARFKSAIAWSLLAFETSKAILRDGSVTMLSTVMVGGMGVVRSWIEAQLILCWS